MRDRLEISIIGIPATTKKQREEIEEKIKTIMNKRKYRVLVDGISVVYRSIVNILNIQSMVVMKGVETESKTRIINMVLNQDILSPRLSIVKYIEGLGTYSTFKDKIDVLVELIRCSLEKRFILYKNVYNLEYSSTNRLYSYTKILEHVWLFHRDYKYYFTVLANLEHRITRVPMENRSKILQATSEQLYNELNRIDLYPGIESLWMKCEEQISINEPIDPSVIAYVKSLKKWFGDLSYYCYYIYGYGSHDLLFLFSDLFDRNGRVKSNKKLIKLNRSINHHIKGFYAGIKRSKNNTAVSLDLREIRSTRCKEYLNTFVVSKYHCLIDSAMPKVNTLFNGILFGNCIFNSISKLTRTLKSISVSGYSNQCKDIFVVFGWMVSGFICLYCLSWHQNKSKNAWKVLILIKLVLVIVLGIAVGMLNLYVPSAPGGINLPLIASISLLMLLGYNMIFRKQSEFTFILLENRLFLAIYIIVVLTILCISLRQ
ncbi:hypothetical protein NEOKW01_0383 [Nematocida sp. AWRm80]|nr:hypothetical protein NEOKW01_0383 [Nematocida sp. AWRm80]